MRQEDTRVALGIAGVGTVGRGVLELLLAQKEALSKKAGVALDVVRVVDREAEERLKGLSGLGDIEVSSDLEDLFKPDVDIVIELIGGIEAARSLVFSALEKKKSLVTANKALLSSFGREIFELAQKQGVELGLEASVGGGIPLVEVIRKNLVANRLNGLYGILNGTSNFILEAMSQKLIPFEKALAEAKAKGYAEADPTLDISGKDTAHKLCVLLGVALDFWPGLEAVYTEGIERVTDLDIAYGAELGLTIKLLAIVKRTRQRIECRVHPVMVPERHLLAHVNGAFNALYLDLSCTGPLLFFGQGAGRYPTASAVVADIVSIAGGLARKACALRPPGSLDGGDSLVSVPMDEIESEHYLRYMVPDVPGMVGKIATALGNHGVSISQVIQKERNEGGERVPVVLLTHKTKERCLKAALHEICSLERVLDDLPQVIRIERFVS